MMFLKVLEIWSLSMSCNEELSIFTLEKRQFGLDRIDVIKYFKDWSMEAGLELWATLPQTHTHTHTHTHTYTHTHTHTWINR